MPALAAICVALSPKFGDWTGDPADTYRTVHRFGVITPTELREVREFWPTIRDQLRGITVADWTAVQELYRAWAHPWLARVQVEQPTAALMTEFAGRMLEDLARLWENQLGPLYWAWQTASTRNIELPTALPPDFLILYPFRDRSDDRETRFARGLRTAQDLGTRWATEPPAHIAARLSTWEAAIASPGCHSWPRWGHAMCTEIAAQVPQPGLWADAFIVAGLPGDFVIPFLFRSMHAGEDGWESRIETALNHQASEGATVDLLLQIEPPRHLWDQVWGRLHRFSNLVLVRAGKQMPEPRMAVLLSHPDMKVAAEAAMGEWYSEPKEYVRPGLADAWRDAVVRGAEYIPDQAWDIFPGLAHDWLAVRIADSDSSWHKSEMPGKDVFDHLTFRERRNLLNCIPSDSFYIDELIQQLIGEDSELFANYLSNERPRWQRLASLARPPLGSWRVLAICALEASVDPEDVARAAFAENGAFFRDDESDHWKDWQSGFTALSTDSDPRLREVGEIGLVEAERRIAEARRRKRHEAVYGEE